MPASPTSNERVRCYKIFLDFNVSAIISHIPQPFLLEERFGRVLGDWGGRYRAHSVKKTRV